MAECSVDIYSLRDDQCEFLGEPLFIEQRNLTLRPFSKIVIILPLGPISFQPWVLGRIYSSRYIFPPMECVLSKMRK